MHYRTKDGNSKYSFHAAPLDNEIVVSCKISGMISTIRTTKLPIALSWEHPISIPENALKILGAFSKAKDWKGAEQQLLAGCILTLLSSKGKTTNFPMSSATEANMMLQSAGHMLLVDLAEIILQRWNSDTTWIRVPKLSFDLAAYQYPAMSMSAAISKYTRIIRKALSLDELPANETAEVYKAFKENTLKAQKEKNKGVQWAEGLANKYLQEMKEKRSFDIGKQIATAKVFFKNLKDHMPKEVVTKCNMILGNMDLISQANKNELAMTIRTIFIGTEQSNMANNLAYILEHAQVATTEEDMLGFSETISPIQKSEKPKTLREIMAEKGIKS